ncbi:hypothetical protein [Hymenobacter sp. UYP22]|uniref:hypothetical protein n=1 Tax=Hymenobacter sp. UYP22 TaxID=3156348 RepID=UPI003398FA4C
MHLLQQGGSGTSRTISALLLVYQIVASDSTKVACIDMERGSAHIYADLGAYQVLPLTVPFTLG